MRILLLLFFISNCFALENVISKSDVLASQGLISNNSNPTNLKDENNYYSSGDITSLPTYIYFNVSDSFYTTYYEINWKYKPKTYKFYISNDCEFIQSNNYTEAKINSTHSLISLNESLSFTDCNNWYQINQGLFVEKLDIKSTADVCYFLICWGLDNYIGKQFLIEITELNQDQTYFEIESVVIDGENSTSRMQLSHPLIVPFNSSTDLNIIDNTEYSHNKHIFLGNKNCTITYKQLDFNEDSSITNVAIDKSTLEIYTFDNSLNISDNAYICYNENIIYSQKYLPQKPPLNIHKVTSINPNKIQVHSTTPINIESTYNWGQYIAITMEDNCNDNIHSETFISNNQGFMMDTSDELGSYYLCHSLDYQLWGINTELKIDIILGYITKVSGCLDHENKTVDCPTEGGVQLFIHGINFNKYFNNLKVLVDEFATSNTTITDNLITTTLPEGMGIDLSITLEFDEYITSPSMLSYKTPEIISVNGCEEDPNNIFKTKNCPNNDYYTLNIIGNNFGIDNSRVLVGSETCNNVVHHSHRNITCTLYGNRGKSQSIFVIQNRGEISQGKDYLSYKECDPGYEFYDNNCHQCYPGTFKSIVGDTYCNQCPDNKFTSDYGKTECDYCLVGYQVTSESSACEPCGHGYFKNDITAITCTPCLENQITYNETEYECHYCELGTEVSDNTCVKCLKGYFKINRDDLRCGFCPDGKYSNELGLSECITCPDNSESNSDRDGCKCNTGYYNNSYDVCTECENTDFHGDELYICDSDDLHLFNIENIEGYWRDNKYSTNFYQCKLTEHCPQKKIVNNTVICLESHQGVLCSLCKDNYAQDSDYICKECSSDISKIQILTISYFLIGIICFIFFITLILLTGRGWLLKIVNYMKENGFVEELELGSESSSQFTDTSSVISSKSNTIYKSNSNLSVLTRRSVSSLSDSSNSSNNTNVSDFYIYDSDTSIESPKVKKNTRLSNLYNINELKELDKKYTDNKIRNDQNNISNISTSEPTDVEENKFLSFAENVQQKVKILISYLQIISLLSSNLNIQWPEFINNIVQGFNFVNLDILAVSQHDIACSFDTNFYNNLILHIITIPGLILCLFISYLISLSLSSKFKAKRKVIKDRFIYCLVLFIFLIYPSIGSALLKTYKCQLIEDDWYLSEDLSQKCFNSTWYKYAILSGIFLLIYVIGIPFVFYRIMKDNLELIKIENQNTKEGREFSYRYGFLYMGYEDRFWWFELVEMMKKIILLATVIYLDESATRILIAMLMCFGYLGYISYNKPLKEDEDDYLNVLSASEIFLMLLCALVLEVKIDIQDTYNQYAFQGFMFVLLMGIVVIGNYEILKSLLGGEIKPIAIIKAIGSSIYKFFTPFYKIMCGANKTIKNNLYDSSDEEEDNLSDKDSSSDSSGNVSGDEIELTEEQSKFVQDQYNNVKRLFESYV